MENRFKVWIDVEEVDDDGNNVMDHDLPFAACAEFDTLEKAVGHAIDCQAVLATLGFDTNNPKT